MSVGPGSGLPSGPGSLWASPQGCAPFKAWVTPGLLSGPPSGPEPLSLSVPPSRPGSLHSPEGGPPSARTPRIYTRTGDEGKALEAAGSTGQGVTADLCPHCSSKASPALSLGRGG